MTITVYSKFHCPQCDATYRMLDRLDTDYTSVDVTEDLAALEYIKGLGYQQAPVVVVTDSLTGSMVDDWSGFRPDRIRQAAKGQASELTPVA